MTWGQARPRATDLDWFWLEFDPKTIGSLLETILKGLYPAVRPEHLNFRVNIDKESLIQLRCILLPTPS